jgi:hypothetical protein
MDVVRPFAAKRRKSIAQLHVDCSSTEHYGFDFTLGDSIAHQLGNCSCITAEPIGDQI